jgi:hypothetical protein
VIGPGQTMQLPSPFGSATDNSDVQADYNRLGTRYCQEKAAAKYESSGIDPGTHVIIICVGTVTDARERFVARRSARALTLPALGAVDELLLLDAHCPHRPPKDDNLTLAAHRRR